MASTNNSSGISGIAILLADFANLAAFDFGLKVFIEPSLCL